MPESNQLFFMHFAYLAATAVFVLAVAAVFVRLWLPAGRRGSPSRKRAGEEFIWTLVPILVLVGLTIVGELPRAWGKIAAGPRGGETQPLRE